MAAPTLSKRGIRALGRALANPGALRAKQLGPQLRERIILHVSSINSCPVCSAVHGAAARAVGLRRDEVRAARECEVPESLDTRTRLALRYAELRTQGDEAGARDAERDLMGEFSPAELREIRAVVDLFTFNNQFNNSWEAWLPGARRRREKLGICPVD